MFNSVQSAALIVRHAITFHAGVWVTSRMFSSGNNTRESTNSSTAQKLDGIGEIGSTKNVTKKLSVGLPAAMPICQTLSFRQTPCFTSTRMSKN